LSREGWAKKRAAWALRNRPALLAKEKEKDHSHTVTAGGTADKPHKRSARRKKNVVSILQTNLTGGGN